MQYLRFKHGDIRIGLARGGQYSHMVPAYSVLGVGALHPLHRKTKEITLRHMAALPKIGSKMPGDSRFTVASVIVHRAASGDRMQALIVGYRPIDLRKITQSQKGFI